MMKNTYRLSAISLLVVFILLFALIFESKPDSASALNQIVEENKKQGTTSWMAPTNQLEKSSQVDIDDLKPYTDSYADSGNGLPSPAQDWSTWTVQGYAGKTSINKGESVTLHINTSLPTYNIDVYRMGWYGGTGGRFIMGVTNLTGQNNAMPTPDPSTGLIDANWPVSYTLQTGSDWVSGYYLIKLTGSDQSVNYIPLVIRDDSSNSDILYQVAFTTYQAYNNWGGKSLYDSNSTGGRAYKVSYNRPYADWWGAGHFFSGDYGMIRFLESKGYDITYATNIDTHSSPDLMNNHKVFLSNWHDEYWSKEMRDNITAARDAGKDLAFFTGNSIYWQIRFEDDALGTPNRIQTCYKDANLDPLSGSDPIRTTVLWRDPPVNMPENELLGVMYGDVLSTNRFDWIVQNSSHWIYDGTGLSDGSVLPQVIGNEYDRFYDNGLAPENLTLLSNSPVLDGQYANSSIYTASSGALVFDAANIEWSLNVDANEFMSFSKNEPSIQRMTTNLLDYMTGSLPALNLQDGEMYGDGLAFHWHNPSSANSIRDFASTAQVFSGTKSIAFTALNEYAILRFEAYDQGILTGPYTHLKFAIYGTAGTQQLGVTLRDMNFTDLSPYLSLANYGGQPTPNQWNIYTIPLTSLNASNTTIGGFALANTSGSAQPVLYIDEVKFINVALETPPASFNKTGPVNGATNQSTAPTLSWEESSGATSYEYCYDTTNDNTCSNWISNGASNSKILSGLSEGTTYYWHVRAINSYGSTYANNNSPTAFWSFTTQVPDLNPTISSITLASTSPTDATTVSYTATFSEAVTGVDINDFSLHTTGVTGASINSVNGSGTTYTVSVNTGYGNGTIRLDVPNTATIQDLSGNPLSGLPFNTGETYEISKPLPDLIVTNAVITPSSPAPNTSFDVSITIKNQGGATGPVTIYRDVYIGTDPSTLIDSNTGCPSAGDFFRFDNFTNLDAGQSDTKTVTVTGGLPNGDYQLWVYVDSRCLVAEAGETNNGQ
ncbi:MAG: hypothetical protein H6634_03055 [Anaerolineales bacterium]|nr:hypothetical protein [Anaerolineales bacterium]